jgi:hypothetical protein
MVPAEVTLRERPAVRGWQPMAIPPVASELFAPSPTSVMECRA